MQLSDKSLYELCDRFDWQYASFYGEPGYEQSYLTQQRAVILGDYWLRGDDKTIDDLQHFEQRWPRIWQALEESGVSFEWYDEWTIDYDHSKAYRTQADSYGWQTSIVWTDDGELITPDDDIQCWIDWAVDNPERCLMSRIHSSADLIAAGFTKWPDDDTFFENGWHPGQTDNPKDILQRIKDHDDELQVVFHIDSVGQWDVRFTAYTRKETE